MSTIADIARVGAMPRHLFDRPQIIAAARRILDADGLDALTIRALASDLGTGPASVYRHVRERRELLQLIADEVAHELPLPDAALGPRDRLLASWSELFDFFAARPWLVDLIAAGEVTSGEATPLAEEHLRALDELGLDPGDRIRAYRSGFAQLFGSLLSAHPYAHGTTGAAAGEQEIAAARDAFLWAVRRLV